MKHKIWINGLACEAINGETMDIENPATGEVIDCVPLGGAEDADLAVAAAKEAFDDGRWSKKTPGERSAILYKMADLIEQNIEEFARVESEDTGKPYEFVSLGGDIPFVIDNLRFFAGAARDITGAASGEYAEGYTSMLRREPCGVTAGITPWNYPLLMAIWKIGPALAAGCTSVIKPAPTTPRTTLMLGEIAQQAGLPDGVLNIVCGGAAPGEALSTHPDVAMVSLTGSSLTGKAIMKSAAETLKRVHLELGGKAPLIVCEDADIDMVAEKATIGGFLNSGQDCTAATRILVHESIYDQTVSALIDATNKFKLGDPFDSDTMIGSMVSQVHRDSVARFVERAKAEGATVVAGGEVVARAGYFYPPTLLVDVKQDSEIVQEEVFGPVMTVQPFKTDDEALMMANDVKYGLASSVFTQDIRRAMSFSRDLVFGTVWINDHLPLGSETPHGGFKQSGFGKDLSAEAISDYMVTKHVMVAI
ncbi:gamma-aminobutyraldehyde dehydrogenase [Vibrio agarivorans]|uniref:gamma-aminobutyraldehyde dehydrogenase n=1 Tax=Vibrio agarivorans TaxID=153622 RepID=UPI0025B5B3E2|nr:gamma-aminobutyraldehyde dehydrogenase [Vibrio agarivorans]MDN3663498.1 gamma-aminobutyraldehyde dehydrogenase [Vibrio agarivorans]